MLTDEEWDWIVEHASGDFDHLVIGTSLPFLLGQGMHFIEAWNEAVCEGAWGKPPLAAASGCAASSTSSTGGVRAPPSRSWRSCSRRSAPASAARRRRRSS